MKVHSSFAVVAAAIGLCCASISSAAHAENTGTSQQDALRQACAQQDGRFEMTWAYNDHGVKWGRVLSCSTKTGKITCQGNVCRSNAKSANNESTASFPAEPRAFSKALAALVRM